LAGAISHQAAEPAGTQAAAYSSPYLDVGAALERISGLTTLYVDIAREFVNALDTVEGDFRATVQEQRAPALVGQMHTLKGTSATLGAIALSKHAAALETLFRRAEPDQVPLDHLPGLLEMVAHTRSATLQAIRALEADSTSEPAVPHRPGGATERARAKVLLEELRSFLNASNLAALDRFEQRGDALDALSPESVEEIRLAFQSLNLPLACQLCETQIAALNQP
jgi:chemotaxis protein histidine kinase CheA